MSSFYNYISPILNIEEAENLGVRGPHSLIWGAKPPQNWRLSMGQMKNVYTLKIMAYAGFIQNE